MSKPAEGMPVYGTAFRRIQAALDAEVQLPLLEEQLASLPPYSGQSLQAAKKLRKAIAQLQNDRFPQGIRDRASQLQRRVERQVRALGYPAWWRREAEILRELRRHRPEKATPPPMRPIQIDTHRTYNAESVRAARKALAALEERVAGLAVYDRSITSSLMKMRSRIRRYTEEKYPADIRQAAATLLDQFGRRVVQLGYAPWWLRDEINARTARSPNWRGHAT